MVSNNCWEEMGCGRELGGVLAVERGVCPAAVEYEATGMQRYSRPGGGEWESFEAD